MTTTRIKSIVRNVVEKSDGAPQPFIGLEDVEGGTGRLLRENLSVKAADDSICHRAGDVLFGKLRPYLAKALLLKAPGTGTSEMLVLRPDPRIDARFLLYVTLSNPWLEWAKATAYGTKMPRTSWELMGNFRIWLPSLEDQRRIVGFLDAQTMRIDLLLQLRDHQIRLVEERSGSALDTAFAGSSHTPTRLKYLLAEKSRYGVLVPKFVDDGVRYIRVNDLLDLPGRADSLARIPAELSAQYTRTVTKPGDVLLSVVGTMGRSAVVPTELAGANVARAVASLRPMDYVPSELLATWLTTPEFLRQANDATGSDTAQPTLGMEDLGNFRLAWPTDKRGLDALTQAAGRIRRQRREVAQVLRRQTALFIERRQALITAAVTGQFDVSTASGRNVTEGITA
ncbi:restriction endonuclease subunit S domain-containing protein [Streptomyces yaizuensis]|uniref:Restriction endonuclease subunit S n=1 Tax=Streptomyces yaizuensis TaxID=2989713 RepID=A0ABQ5NWS1_9ACTN|nr:restriction endonuclease subunit S [Streptomyces sp. YSPA8]GLF94659.1 restriction endonuclease subunit S [Streptomyces sp. YSPA8]